MTAAAPPTAAAGLEPAPRRVAVSLAAAALAICAVVLGLLAQDGQGVTWDEVIGDLPHGERRLEYLLTLDPARLDPSSLPAAASLEGHLRYPPAQFGSEMIYSVAPILSAVSCRIFFQELGLLSSLAAHHLVAVLSAALLLFVVVRFVSPRAGLLAGISAGLLLATSPRFAAHAVNNVKDAPEAFLYTAAYLAAFVALERGGRGRFVMVGALAGLALAQKGNALFLGPQLLLLALLQPRGARAAAWRGLLLAGGIAGAAFLVASPAVWADPSLLLRQLEFVMDKGRVDPIPFVRSDGEPLLLLAVDPLDGWKNALWSTPEPVWLLGVAGLFARVPWRLRAALAIGVAVPISRTLLPGAINFDGVRHYLEFLPPLAMLAGLGVARLRETVASAWTSARRAAGPVLAALAVAPGAFLIATTAPHEVCAFDASVGGLAGARAAGLREADDYWGTSIPAALRFVDRTAPPGAQVVVPVGPHLASADRERLLAPDRALVSLAETSPDRTTFVVVLHRERFFSAAVRELRRAHQPARAIRVQGAVIAEVFRLDDGEEIEALRRIDARAAAARARLQAWLLNHPERAPVVLALFGERHRRGLEPTLRALRDVLPSEHHEDAAIYLR
ncbi:MAG: ArnT family glycosyltransferase [Planctomycetota bacterium JB042]